MLSRVPVPGPKLYTISAGDVEVFTSTMASKRMRVKMIDVNRFAMIWTQIGEMNGNERSRASTG